MTGMLNIPGLGPFAAMQDRGQAQDLAQTRQLGMLADVLQSQSRNTMLREQLDIKRGEAALAQERAQQQQALLSSLPPQLRAIGMLDPKALARVMEDPFKQRVVGPGAAVVRGDEAVFTQPFKPAEGTQLEKWIAARDALPEGDPNRRILDLAIQKATTHAPSANVTINQGEQRTFERENKLRSDFRADERIKAASEMDSAFRLIETAAKNPSPANDLAMATKYMKVLDPTSVVRESELAMAMNASGMMDRVLSYANRVVTGEKLTPTQRRDFYESARAINQAFQQGVTPVVEEYRNLARRYGLDENAIMPGRNPGPAASGPASGGVRMPTQAEIDAELARREKR